MFDRDGGGQLILPLEEVVIISTFTRNQGTEIDPDWQVDDTRCVVRVRTLEVDIAILHTAKEALRLLKNATKKSD